MYLLSTYVVLIILQCHLYSVQFILVSYWSLSSLERSTPILQIMTEPVNNDATPTWNVPPPDIDKPPLNELGSANINEPEPVMAKAVLAVAPLLTGTLKVLVNEPAIVTVLVPVPDAPFVIPWVADANTLEIELIVGL